MSNARQTVDFNSFTFWRSTPATVLPASSNHRPSTTVPAPATPRHNPPAFAQDPQTPPAPTPRSVTSTAHRSSAAPPAAHAAASVSTPAPQPSPPASATPIHPHGSAIPIDASDNPVAPIESVPSNDPIMSSPSTQVVPVAPPASIPPVMPAPNVAVGPTMTTTVDGNTAKTRRQTIGAVVVESRALTRPAKRMRKVRKERQMPAHYDIPTGRPEEERLVDLVSLLLSRVRSEQMEDMTVTEGKAFDEAVAYIKAETARLAEEVSGTCEAVGNVRRTNEKDEMLRVQEKQLEFVVEQYEAEREGWCRVLSEVEEQVSQHDDGEDLEDSTVADLVKDVQQLEEASTKAVETFVLHADQMRNELRRVQGQNMAAERKMNSIVTALHGKFRTQAEDMTCEDLQPPANMANLAV